MNDAEVIGALAVKEHAAFGNMMLARQAAEAIERLTAELDALRKDAERYRWLRDEPADVVGVVLTSAILQADWDRTIDTAMQGDAP